MASPTSTCVSFGVHTMQASTSCQARSSSSWWSSARRGAVHRCSARPASRSATPTRRAPQIGDGRQMHVGDEAGPRRPPRRQSSQLEDVLRHLGGPLEIDARVGVQPERVGRFEQGRVAAKEQPIRPTRRTTSRVIARSGKEVDSRRRCRRALESAAIARSGVPGPSMRHDDLPARVRPRHARERLVPTVALDMDLQRSTAPRHLAQQLDTRATGRRLARYPQWSLTPMAWSARYAASIA